MKASIGIAAAATLFLGIADLPIGYYTFLRIAVTIAALLFLYWGIQEERNVQMVVFGVIAILFNPIVPVYLYDKSIWMVIDGIAGGTFLVFSFLPRRTSGTK